MDHLSPSWDHLDPSWAYLGANLGAEKQGATNFWGVAGGHRWGLGGGVVI